MRRPAWWWLACAALGGPAVAQVADPAGPATLEARTLQGRADDVAVAEGEVELRRGGVTLRAERLTYRRADETAFAEGQVEVRQGDNRFTGPRLELRVPTFEGRFDAPTYQLGAQGAVGRHRSNSWGDGDSSRWIRASPRARVRTAAQTRRSPTGC